MKQSEKLIYEKPTSVEAGKIDLIFGACENGSAALDGCIVGNNPNVGPVCQPTGNIATYNCGSGNTNTDGNCNSNGTTASGACNSMGVSPV